MKGKTKAALAAAAAAVTAAASSVLTTKIMMDTATRREEPKFVKMTGALNPRPKPDSQSAAFRREASERLKNRQEETVSVTAFDGLRLVAHWFPQDQGKRVVIAVHGWRTSWHRDFGMMADFLRDSGCSVLYIEQRGQGDSDGEYMSFGGGERFDCLSWVDWVIKNVPGELPIYLYGVSMGASSVMMASGLSLPNRVHGVIADCGFTSVDDMWRYLAKERFHMFYGPRRAIARRMFDSRTPSGSYDGSTEDALGSTKTPLLLIHGTADRFVPVEMTYRNYIACAAPKRLLIVPGAVHARSIFTEPERYIQAVTDFFREFDGYRIP